MKLSDMKVGWRLALGFGLVTLLLAAVAAIAIQRIHVLNAVMDQLLNDRVAKVMLAKQIQLEVNAQARFLRNAIIGAADPAEVSSSLDKMAASARKNDELMAQIDAKIRSEKGRQLYQEMVTARKAYGEARTAAVKLLTGGDAAAAGAYVLKEVRPVQTKFFDALDALAEFQLGLMRSDSAAAHEDGAAAVTMTLGLALAAGAAALVIAWLIARSISRPVAQAVGLAQTIASGDLTADIEVRSKDEVGMLLQALKEMNAKLLHVVSQVREGTDEIATATGEVARGNLDLSARTEQQAGALEETASSMEELTSTVRHNSENARQARQLADSAAGVARQGGEVVAEVVATMGTISESSSRMSDIIGVIDGIAFQTNILALNAAVEAARAGEQGRGFAVVASEVRSLAQRSAAAAKEIKDLIDDSTGKVASGNRLVAQAGDTIREVVASVQRVTDIMGEIAEASREQETGIEQINEAVAQMDTVTQQNAALVEEAAAATASLNERADQLSALVSVFKTSAGEQRRVAAVPAPAAAPVAPARRSAPVRLAAPAVKAVPPMAPRRSPKPVAVAAGGGDWEEF
ncbi:methyl-accepting chemotaxis protein [Oxalobacteraceae bacterium A2-2]